MSSSIGMLSDLRAEGNSSRIELLTLISSSIDLDPADAIILSIIVELCLVFLPLLL